jgi:hypothetical protein
MSGYTTTSTLSVLMDKRPMRKRRRNVKKSLCPHYTNQVLQFQDRCLERG